MQRLVLISNRMRSACSDDFSRSKVTKIAVTNTIALVLLRIQMEEGAPWT